MTVDSLCLKLQMSRIQLAGKSRTFPASEPVKISWQFYFVLVHFYVFSEPGSSVSTVSDYVLDG
jgi:hypothetical protein